MVQKYLLVLESFYGVSHKHMIDLILFGVPGKMYDLITLPATKWHWRSRCSSLYFSQVIPENHAYTWLFVTSVVNLAELVGLRPDLVGCHKIVYFHENQMLYPVTKNLGRDFQHIENDIFSALAADQVLLTQTSTGNRFWKTATKTEKSPGN